MKKPGGTPCFLIATAIALLAIPVIWPRIDLIMAAWFYKPGEGFYLSEYPAFNFFHEASYYGARLLGISLAMAAFIAGLRHRPLAGVTMKGWLFLLLALMIGPGLVGNALLKDHWGRARPREVTEFAGNAAFSPVYAPQPDAHRNESFIAGDAAFGFYLTSFAYVVPAGASRRRTFGIGILAGALLGVVRIAMGAHFLSDVLYAGFFMLASIAAVYAAMFGRKETRDCWRDFTGGA